MRITSILHSPSAFRNTRNNPAFYYDGHENDTGYNLSSPGFHVGNSGYNSYNNSNYTGYQSHNANLTGYDDATHATHVTHSGNYGKTKLDTPRNFSTFSNSYGFNDFAGPKHSLIDGSNASISSNASSSMNKSSAMTPLYQAMVQGDWNAAMSILKVDPSQAGIWIARNDHGFSGLDRDENRPFNHSSSEEVEGGKGKSAGAGGTWKFLPIHAACSSTRFSNGISKSHYGSHSSQTREHQPAIPMQLVQALLAAHPNGVRTMDTAGKFPLHYACGASSGTTSDITIDRSGGATIVQKEIIYLLLTSFPQAAMRADNLGKLPLHYLVTAGADGSGCCIPGGTSGAGAPDSGLSGLSGFSGGVLQMILVATGSLSHAPDQSGCTPLSLAKAKADQSLGKEWNNDSHANGGTPNQDLLAHLKEGREWQERREIVRLLTEYLRRKGLVDEYGCDILSSESMDSDSIGGFFGSSGESSDSANPAVGNTKKGRKNKRNLMIDVPTTPKHIDKYSSPKESEQKQQEDGLHRFTKIEANEVGEEGIEILSPSLNWVQVEGDKDDNHQEQNEMEVKKPQDEKSFVGEEKTNEEENDEDRDAREEVADGEHEDKNDTNPASKRTQSKKTEKRDTHAKRKDRDAAYKAIANIMSPYSYAMQSKVYSFDSVPESGTDDNQSSCQNTINTATSAVSASGRTTPRLFVYSFEEEDATASQSGAGAVPKNDASTPRASGSGVTPRICNTPRTPRAPPRTPNATMTPRSALPPTPVASSTVPASPSSRHRLHFSWENVEEDASGAGTADGRVGSTENQVHGLRSSHSCGGFGIHGGNSANNGKNANMGRIVASASLDHAAIPIQRNSQQKDQECNVGEIIEGSQNTHIPKSSLETRNVSDRLGLMSPVNRASSTESFPPPSPRFVSRREPQQHQELQVDARDDVESVTNRNENTHDGNRLSVGDSQSERESQQQIWENGLFDMDRDTDIAGSAPDVRIVDNLLEKVGESLSGSIDDESIKREMAKLLKQQKAEVKAEIEAEGEVPASFDTETASLPMQDSPSLDNSTIRDDEEMSKSTSQPKQLTIEEAQVEEGLRELLLLFWEKERKQYQDEITDLREAVLKFQGDGATDIHSINQDLENKLRTIEESRAREKKMFEEEIQSLKDRVQRSQGEAALETVEVFRKKMKHQEEAWNIEKDSLEKEIAELKNEKETLIHKHGEATYRHLQEVKSLRISLEKALEENQRLTNEGLSSKDIFAQEKEEMEKTSSEDRRTMELKWDEERRKLTEEIEALKNAANLQAKDEWDEERKTLLEEMETLKTNSSAKQRKDEESYNMLQQQLADKERVWEDTMKKLEQEITVIKGERLVEQNAENRLREEMEEKERQWEKERCKYEEVINGMKDAADSFSLEESTLPSNPSTLSFATGVDHSALQAQLENAVKEAEDMRQLNSDIKLEHNEVKSKLESDLEKEQLSKKDLLLQIATLKGQVATFEQTLEEMKKSKKDSDESECEVGEIKTKLEEAQEEAEATRKVMVSLSNDYQEKEKSHYEQLFKYQDKVKELEIRLSEAAKLQEEMQEKEKHHVQQLEEARKIIDKLQQKGDLLLKEVDENLKKKEDSFFRHIKESQKREQVVIDNLSAEIEKLQRESNEQKVQYDVLQAQLQDQLSKSKKELDSQSRRHQSELNKMKTTLELQRSKESRLNAHVKSMEAQISDMVMDYEARLQEALMHNYTNDKFY